MFIIEKSENTKNQKGGLLKITQNIVYPEATILKI